MLKLFILLATFWTIYAKATPEYQRPLVKGELVIHFFGIHEVLSVEEKESYKLKSVDNFGWEFSATRNQIAIMNGCAEDICVSDPMFDTGYMRFVTVEGLTFDGDPIVEASEGWDGFYQPFKNNLAKTLGCHPDGHKKICIGDRVKTLYDQVMIVAAFQRDNKLVLKSTDGLNTFQSNVDPASLIVLH